MQKSGNMEHTQQLFEALSQVEGYIYPNEVPLQWSILIVLYPYITGLVAGAFILASLERVFKMKVLTPTYHVFEMYKVHQDAELMDVVFGSPKYIFQDQSMDAISISASKDSDGNMNFTLVNVDPNNDFELNLNTEAAGSKVSGRILTAEKLNSHNTYDNPDVVKTAKFNDAKIEKGAISMNLPAKSIVVLSVEGT